MGNIKAVQLQNDSVEAIETEADSMASDSLQRYIKDSTGQKVELKITSINLEIQQHDFVKVKRLNLSLLVRDLLNSLMAKSKP